MQTLPTNFATTPISQSATNVLIMAYANLQHGNTNGANRKLLSMLDKIIENSKQVSVYAEQLQAFCLDGDIGTSIDRLVELCAGIGFKLPSDTKSGEYRQMENEIAWLHRAFEYPSYLIGQPKVSAKLHEALQSASRVEITNGKHVRSLSTLSYLKRLSGGTELECYELIGYSDNSPAPSRLSYKTLDDLHKAGDLKIFIESPCVVI